VDESNHEEREYGELFGDTLIIAKIPSSPNRANEAHLAEREIKELVP
jgi:hypothetical protein